MKISVVVPVCNEAENILPLTEEIERAMSLSEAYEIIYVDDGSTDNTAFVIRELQKTLHCLRLIAHQRSYGQSAAIRTGIQAARYPIIATLDGDGQNDPADIVRLCAILVERGKTIANLCMVAGWRTQRHDSDWKLFSSKVANGIRSRLLGDHTPDTGCGLKVFFRDVFLALPYFDHMHRFLPALVLRSGGLVISEPVNHRPRIRGVSKYGTLDRLWVGLFDMVGVIWLQKRFQQVEATEIDYK